MEIVAEISGNHGGKLDNALKLIRAAIDAGADAVKFQCFDPVRLATKREGIEWEGRRQSRRDLYSLYHRTWTQPLWFPTLIAYCADEIPWFSSVFDPEDVAFLESLGCPRYKISAYEMLDGDLIKAVVKTGKPIVMSVRPRPGVTVLQASDYDGSYAPTGLSDHSPPWDEWRGAAAAGYGCPMIERHIRLPHVETPDSAFSLDPGEFKAFVERCRKASKSAL